MGNLLVSLGLTHLVGMASARAESGSSPPKPPPANVTPRLLHDQLLDLDREVTARRAWEGRK